MNVRLLHISDIHFGPPHLDALDAAISSWIGREKPDALVVSGDLTQRARPDQFAAARRFLQGLALPQVVVPGNHDVPLWAVHLRLLAPFQRYRTHFSETLEPVLRLPGAWIFGLNTARGFAFKNGVFREGALARCTAFFRDAPPGALRVVAAHHHLVQSPVERYDPAAWRAERARRVFSEAGVDLVLSGHLHHGFMAPAAPGGSPESRPWVVHSGTSMSARGRGGEHGMNTMNLIESSADSVRIVRLRHTGGERFESIAERRIERRAAPLPTGAAPV